MTDAHDAHDDRVLRDIFAALQRSEGHERVTDANVEALIAMAQRAGDATLETLLREWRSPCGDDPDMPALEPKLPPP